MLVQGLIEKGNCAPGARLKGRLPCSPASVFSTSFRSGSVVSPRGIFLFFFFSPWIQESWVLVLSLPSQTQENLFVGSSFLIPEMLGLHEMTSEAPSSSKIPPGI